MAKHRTNSSSQRKGRHRSSRADSPGHTRKFMGPAALRRRENSARERALKALWAIRQGGTLSKAARENGVTVRTIKRYVGSALVQDRPGGRIRATKSDR